MVASKAFRAAERNLRQCEKRVARQQRVVDRLRLSGEPAPEAFALLEEYEAALTEAADMLQFMRRQEDGA